MIDAQRFQTAITYAETIITNDKGKKFLNGLDQDNIQAAIMEWKDDNNKDKRTVILNELLKERDDDAVRTFNTLYLMLGEA